MGSLDVGKTTIGINAILAINPSLDGNWQVVWDCIWVWLGLCIAESVTKGVLKSIIETWANKKSIRLLVSKEFGSLHI